MRFRVTFTPHGRRLFVLCPDGYLTMTTTNSPSRSSSLWQQRIQGMREFEVIREGNIFSTSFSRSFVYTSDYENARRHLTLLLAQYQDAPFNAVFHGRDVTNDAGTCVVQESRHPLSPCKIDTVRFREENLADLTLVRGIGPATEKKLKMRGFRDITDLCSHPRYRADAEEVLSCLSDGDTLEIMNLLGGRHTRSHPGILGTAGMHEAEDFVFFDIETLGLFSRPIILFGIGSLEHGSLMVHQYLLREIEEEPSALMATIEHLSGDHPALITFNGKAFDLPYLSDRLAYYGMGSMRGIPHFDMLPFSRRWWKQNLPSCRLTALEHEILGVRRKEDIPGQMVPEFYEIYLRTGNCGPLVPILEHNCQDVVSLARLFFHLVGETYGCS